LIERVDRWVVQSVLDWLARQNVPEELDLIVSVNLSGASTADASFQDFLSQAITQAGINPHHLCFEITETSAMQDLAGIANFLNQIRALGCQVALDDFGTGFSSLGYIKQLPVDFIKIDGAFIRDIVESPVDQALVRCVADVATILNTQTVAEFVENDATMEVLRELGIDMAQGYLFAKPRPLSDLKQNQMNGDYFLEATEDAALKRAS